MSGIENSSRGWLNRARENGDEGDDEGLTDGKEMMFRRVERSATEHMHHGYLALRKVRQSVSRFHFDAGYAILSAAAVDLSETEQVLTALLLLQQGLSIHDHVDEYTDDVRGLIVLAGDHNSSKYYYILAELGDSGIMFALCEAVASMNEAKMILSRERKSISSGEYMSLMETIEGGLLRALATYYLGQSGTWTMHISSLVQAHIVQSELISRHVTQHFTVRQASEWLADSLERVVKQPSTSLVGPLYTFFVEYFNPIQETVEHLHLAEGKG